MRIIKIILTMLIILALLPIVMGDLSMCGSNPIVNTTCIMPSPAISCTNYSYKVINVTSGLIVTQGVMGVVNGNIRYFNFSQLSGDYIIRLCDDTTREVFVGRNDDDMTLAIIILLPIIIGCMLLYIAFKLSDEHTTMAIFMFMLGLASSIVSLTMAVATIIRFYSGWNEMNTILSNTSLIAALVAIIFAVYFMIYLTIRAIEYFRTRRLEKAGL